MIQDMTKGNALKLILLFSLPILIGNVFQQLYQLADISSSAAFWAKTRWQPSARRLRYILRF